MTRPKHEELPTLPAELAEAIGPHVDAIAHACGLEPAALGEVLRGDVLPRMIRAAEARRANGNRGGRPASAEIQDRMRDLWASRFFVPIADEAEADALLSGDPDAVARHKPPPPGGFDEALTEELRGLAGALADRLAAGERKPSERRNLSRKLRKQMLDALRRGDWVAKEGARRAEAHEDMLRLIAAYGPPEDW